MKPPRRYATAAAFRVALEERLKTLAQEESLDLQRVRRQVAFDRLLGRLFSKSDAPWLLKGGYAMELRLRTARATRDMDLALKTLPMENSAWEANAATVLESLRELGQLDLEDFFTFVFGDATQDLDAAPYGGARFRVDMRLAGRSFAKFHVDVTTGDVLREPYESLVGRDWLRFAGVANTVFRAVSPEEQFAEKLHAYTLPKVGRENTRVKDLVDLVLLITRTSMNAAHLPESIRQTFHRRKTHRVPLALDPPPAFWARPFSEIAVECGLEPDMKANFEVVAQFFDRLTL